MILYTITTLHTSSPSNFLSRSCCSRRSEEKKDHRASETALWGLVPPLSLLCTFRSLYFFFFEIHLNAANAQVQRVLTMIFVLFLWNTLGNTLHKVGNGENRDPCHSHSQKFKFFYTGTHIYLTRSFVFFSFCFSLILLRSQAFHVIFTLTLLTGESTYLWLWNCRRRSNGDWSEL